MLHLMPSVVFRCLAQHIHEWTWESVMTMVIDSKFVIWSMHTQVDSIITALCLVAVTIVQLEWKVIRKRIQKHRAELF